MKPEQILSSWVSLNNFLRETTSEHACWELVRHEQKREKPRGVYLLRAHSRACRLRANRLREQEIKEREELLRWLEEMPMQQRGAGK